MEGSGSDTRAAQVHCLNQFIEGWKGWTPEGWSATQSADFTLTILPFSLGHPARSKEEVKLMLPKLMSTVHDYKVSERYSGHIIG